MGVSGAVRAAGQRLSSSRLIASGVVLTIVLGTAGFVIGHADSALHIHISPGDAWLPSDQRGSVSLVDGTSGRASAELQLTGARGHHLVVTQVGNLVLVRDTTTGMLIRIDTAQLALGTATRTPGGTVMVSGIAATYLVNYQAGTAQQIDPVTLSPLGPVVRFPGIPGPSAVVDRNGTLWMPIPSAGTVVPVTSHGLGKPVRVAAAGASLVLTTAGGTPIVVDRTAHRLAALGLAGASNVLTLPASAALGGSGALLVPASGTAGSLPLVDTGGSPSLVIVDLTQDRTRSVPLGAEVSGHHLGSPLQAGQRVFVPDYSSGSVLIYDTTAAAVTATIPVLGHPGTFQSEVIDGIAYFNNPAGNQAVVVTPDGQVHQVSKSGPQVPVAHPSHAPSAPPRASHGNGSHRGGHPGRGPSPGPSRPSPQPSARPSSPQPGNSPAPPPLAPVNPRAMAGAGFVDVSWQPPVSGGSVQRYVVGVSPAAPGMAQASTGQFSVRVSGLSCSAVYSFTVYSVGSGGQRVPAAPVTARPCTAPGQPQNLRSSVSQHQIQLSWSAPAGTGGPVSYTVSWNGGSHTGLTGTTDTITGLVNFQTYTVTVTAANAAGSGQSSLSVSLSPGTTWGYHIYNNATLRVNVRSGPSTSAGILGSFGPNSNAPVQVVCQLPGGSYRDPTGSPSGNLWDRIAYNGGTGYVADGYVNTPNSMNNTYSPPIWACS